MTIHRAISRRQAIQLSGSVLGSLVLPSRLLRAAEGIQFKDNPFALGIASGCPTADSIVLWTRLVDPQLSNRLRNSAIPVDWVIANDEQLKTVVQRGTFHATSEFAHSVHAELHGLQPARDYWYRFTAGGQQSAIGHTRTAPLSNAHPQRLRIAVASCQKYENGFYVAYRHMLDDDLDLIVHVGDYIYEYASSEGNLTRGVELPEAVDLETYRAHYALYKSDVDLQAAHAAYPWLVTWDDHEVTNDYSGDFFYDGSTKTLLARRAAAYRAYYEHMPLPRECMPVGPAMDLRRQYFFGDLANISMLDSRQYRSAPACLGNDDRNPNGADCSELFSANRTKLGEHQERWLATQFAQSKARWNIVAQGTPMAHVDQQSGPGAAYRRDTWDGYPAARQRFLNAVVETKVRNPVVIDGDIHAFQVANLNKQANDLHTPVVASELTTSSITSFGISQKRLDERRQENPNILLSDATYRGYLLMDANAERLQTELVTMDTIQHRQAKRGSLAKFVIENGKPGPVKI